MKKLTILLAAVAFGASAMAQGTIDDYKRAFGHIEKYSGKTYCANINPRWIGDTDRLWYARDTRQGREYVLVDVVKKKKTPLFDHKALATELSKATGRDVAANALDLKWLRVSDGADTLRFVSGDRQYAFAVKPKRLIDEGALPKRPEEPHWMVVDDEKGNEPVMSPDGKHTAYIKNDNVYVRDNATGQERALSQDGTLGNYYSSRIVWSPDGKKVATCKLRPAAKRYVYYVESSPADQLQPKLHKQEYAKPGDELNFKVPCIFNVETGEALIPETTLFDSQYEIYGPEWNDDSKAITFDYNERGHKVYRVLEMSAADGSVRPLVEETHDKYVNYPRIFKHYLSDGKRMIWSSERDNYNHLYMYDRATGQPTHQITRGPWYVRQVIDIDEEAGVIYFTANGVDADIDPYLIKYYVINFDGTGMRCLTPAEGMHQASLSADKRYVADVYSKVDQAPRAVVRDASGAEVMTLEEADITDLLAEGWQAPEVFVAKGRDGVTDMWGIILRPSNFDPSVKYPVVEYIYQGPGDHYVPKTFAPYQYYMSPLTELGFIVVMVDGMGTSFRSREFENICYKNLKDAALPDHIAWLRAAGERYPYMDLDRVGIYGCSAGGQESTNAVLLHPDFYKAAYSACGCHDNRMDKIWWNELWMGYPVDEAYTECSNVANAHLLERPLMLVVGELDDNVDPASTMQVVDALIKANKDFELVVIPGAHHTMGEDYGTHKRYDFFTRHLHGVTPPAWKEVKSEE